MIEYQTPGWLGVKAPHETPSAVPFNVALIVVPLMVWPQLTGVALQIRSLAGGPAQFKLMLNADEEEKPETKM
jgi:hypothetical protein